MGFLFISCVSAVWNNEKSVIADEINKTMMYPPFEIRAIGDSGLLKSVMEMPDSILKKLEYNNIESKVEASEYVFIPKYNGAAIWLYGRSLLGAVEDEAAPEAANEAGVEG